MRWRSTDSWNGRRTCFLLHLQQRQSIWLHGPTSSKCSTPVTQSFHMHSLLISLLPSLSWYMFLIFQKCWMSKTKILWSMLTNKLNWIKDSFHGRALSQRKRFKKATRDSTFWLRKWLLKKWSLLKQWKMKKAKKNASLVIRRHICSNLTQLSLRKICIAIPSSRLCRKTTASSMFNTF